MCVDHVAFSRGTLERDRRINHFFVEVLLYWTGLDCAVWYFTDTSYEITSSLEVNFQHSAARMVCVE